MSLLNSRFDAEVLALAPEDKAPQTAVTCQLVEVRASSQERCETRDACTVQSSPVAQGVGLREVRMMASSRDLRAMRPPWYVVPISTLSDGILSSAIECSLHWIIWHIR